MAYNTKTIKSDAGTNKIPQIFDVMGDDYAPHTGQNLGGNRYGADVLAWGKTAGGLFIPLKVEADGSLDTEVSGSYASLKSAPVVGAKTVATVAAEIFAGVSRLANRYLMSLYNESSLIVYWGGSGVTTATGYPLLPGDSVVISFDKTVATAIYCISSGSAAVRVVELA
jgi:hypothetical protein